MKPQTKWKKKLEGIKKLAKSAMTDKPQWRPAEGYVYIKDVEEGQLVTTGSGTKAIVTDPNDSATVVYCTEHRINDKFYLGSQRWSGTTEVKIVK